MSDQDEKPGAEASTEQAADLAALTMQAQADTPAPGTVTEPAKEAKPPSATSLQAAVILVGMVRPVACYMVKPLAGAPDELWEPVAPGLAALLDHYEVGSEIFSNPWAQFAFGLAPLAGYAIAHQVTEAEAKPGAGQVIEGQGATGQTAATA